MFRARAVFIIGLFVTSTTLVSLAHPASASTLAVDAGASQAAYNGAPIPVTALAAGGAQPYNFAWTFQGSPARFADPNAASTTFDTTGLAPGAITLTVTVTDAASQTASDTVVHHVDVAPVVLDVTRTTTTPGLPDEILAPGLADRNSFTYTFAVPAGFSRLQGVLDWEDANGGNVVGNDFDVELLRPNGASATGAQGQTLNKPERVSVDNPEAGNWRARVDAFLTTPDTFHLLVQALPANPLPTASANGPYTFATLDAQTLTGTGQSGAGIVASAWDLNDDGIFETPGGTATSTFGVGTHFVSFRATDANGFEAQQRTTVTVLDAQTVRGITCAGSLGRLMAMEFTASKGSCWMHGGHHTYYFGDDVYHLKGGSGWLFTVEQQFTPPTSYALPEDPTTDPIDTHLVIETSMNGKSWTQVGHAEYRFLDNPVHGIPPVLSEGFARQRVNWVIQPTDIAMRYLRIREPLSAAQGLSGYLDHTEGAVALSVTPTPPPQGGPAVQTLTCDNDLMEAFFDTHPCWFGGINRYDAPSFFHTYPLGRDTPIARLSGTVQMLPWRTDDWFAPIQLGNLPGWAPTAVNIRAFVQVSTDGAAWQNVGEVWTQHGVPGQFDIDLSGAGVNAKFVRFLPDYHPRYDEPCCTFAANHHPKAFFTYSEVTVTRA